MPACAPTTFACCATVLSDSLRYAFDSAGVHYLLAIVIDTFGARWTDSIPVMTVDDIPVAEAGNDTGVFTGSAVYLHDSARQQFGSVTAWEWKIGAAPWVRTSGSDTAFIAPSDDRVLACSLAVYDDDGNRGADEVRIVVSKKVTSVSAAMSHTLILKSDGSLWTCGSNLFGQLGNGTMEQCLIPLQVMNEVQSISAGNRHTLILGNDHTLRVCGSNDIGQLGIGTLKQCSSPVQIMNDVQSITAGMANSFIIKTDGSLWACGENNWGQLGNGSTKTAFTPVRIIPFLASQ